MTDRAPDTLRPLLLREHAALRRALVVRHVLRALAASAAWIALLLLAGAALTGGPSLAVIRLGLLVLGIAFALAAAVLALRRDVPRVEPWLESLEHRFPELRSWLRNALDLEAAPDPHTSAALAGALRADAARRLRATPLASERPRVRARTPLLVCAAAVAAVALLAVLAPGAARRSWRTLWNPALAAPPVTLVVEPGSVTLSPGATLAVRARVQGTAAAPRLLGAGSAPAPQLEATEAGVRRWRFDLPPVTRARDYAVRVASVQSRRYHIGLLGRPQPVSFAFEYRSPAYARLPAQSGTSTSGDVAALRGSTAAVEVTFDRDIESLDVRLPGGARAEWTAVTPRRWHGTLPVREDGEWSLRASAASGAGEYQYRVSALPDAPPVISVLTPRGDQDLPAGSRVPFDVLVQDDLGLTDLRLQYRKESAQPWRDVSLSAFQGEPREAHVAADWDAAALALLPGESGSFRFVVRDNDRIGGPASAASAEFHLRFPSMSELYSGLDRRQESVQQSLQQVAEHARELQKQLDQLDRQQPRPGATPPQYERTEEMRKALERQKDLAKQIDQATEDTRTSMTDAAERQAFRQDLQDKLHQMSELMRQIQSPEFRDAMKRMQEALEKMDHTAMEQTLPKLREQNKDLLKSLERSLALLKQMRDEERMDALAKRAEELKARQDAMNREHAAQAKPDAAHRPEAGGTDKNLAERQRAAARQSEQLAKDARDAAQQTESPDAKQDLQDAAQQLEQKAAAQQQSAAQQAESGQSQQASQSGEQASESLQQAGQKMNRSSQSAQAQRSARQLAAVRRSTRDLVSVGQEASQNMQGSGSEQGQADRQTDLSDGVARVADSLAALGRETPVLSPQVQEALGRAMTGLSKSGRDLAQGDRARGQAEGRSAGSALGEAIQALRGAEAGMCNKPGSKPGGGPGEAMSPGERVGQMGQKQGQLNERSRQLAERLSQATRLSPGDQAEMRRLADEQARLRSELEDIQGDDATRHQLLGRLDQARKEMQEAEEMIRQGNTGPELEDHQTHILSRLLDAARSINRRDYDPEREAQRADDIVRTSPAPLPGALLRVNDRARSDLMKADADRYPAQYRALIERYLQRLNGSVR